MEWVLGPAAVLMVFYLFFAAGKREVAEQAARDLQAQLSTSKLEADYFRDRYEVMMLWAVDLCFRQDTTERTDPETTASQSFAEELEKYRADCRSEFRDLHRKRVAWNTVYNRPDRSRWDDGEKQAQYRSEKEAEYHRRADLA